MEVTVYSPLPRKLKMRQAWRIARRYSDQSVALALLASKRSFLTSTHLVACLYDAKQLFQGSPRGPGYCLRRAELTDLHAFILDNYRSTQN